jgi:hypothetical protein
VNNIQNQHFSIFLNLSNKSIFMEKIITISTLLFTCFSFVAQQQIGNSDMELWENIGQAAEEPTNWNSFKSAQGSFTSFASQQLQRSTSVRAGASGQYCARIYSKSTLGIVANGNMTLGRINMGSTTPSSADNYNISLTADPNFSESITNAPDSLVFWVKFTPASGNPNARVHAVLHDAYDLRDPIDANSLSHVISRAELNYPSTAGQWVRKSVPFVNEGTAVSPQYLLVTFTTNQTPGGGAANDEVLVDDIELIYNQTGGIGENNSNKHNTYYSIHNGLQIEGVSDEVTLINTSGIIVKCGKISELNGTFLNSGIYFIRSKNSVSKLLVP